MKNVTQTEWRALLTTDDNAVIIDSRTPVEWNEGVLENAILLNINNPQSFMDGANKLDNKRNYYVYCRSGNRSVMACQVLESVGIKTTYNLLGGITEWDGNLVTPSSK